jgi:hypothetical protein
VGIEASSAPGLIWLGCPRDRLKMIGSCEPDQYGMRDQDSSPDPSRGQLFVCNQVIKRPDTHSEHPGRLFPGMEEALHLRFREKQKPLFSVVVVQTPIPSYIELPCGRCHSIRRKAGCAPAVSEWAGSVVVITAMP